MKNFKMINSIALALVLCASSLAHAEKGGNSGGGGGNTRTRQAKKVFSEHVDARTSSREALVPIALLVEFKLAGEDYRGIQTNDYPSEIESQLLSVVYKKVFQSKRSFYEVLDDVEMEMGLCKSNGKAVDASAFVRNGKNVVCMNMTRLRKLNTDEVQREVIGLVAHEVSHFFGTTEEEAKVFQKIVISNTSLNATKLLPAATQSYVNALGSVLGRISELRSIQPALTIEFCSAASRLNERLRSTNDSLRELSEQTGVRLLRPYSESRPVTAQISLGGFAETVCKHNDSRLAYWVPNSIGYLNEEVCEKLSAAVISKHSRNHDALKYLEKKYCN